MGNSTPDTAVSNIETRAIVVCDQAKGFLIATDEDASEATRFLNTIINPLIREGDELFDPMIASAYQTHQLSIATKRKAVGGLPAAKTLLRNELARYAQILEERARAEQLRIEAQAAADDAARLEREVEAAEAAGLAAGSWPEDIAEEVKAIVEAPRAMTLPPPAPPPITIPGARDVYKAVVVSVQQLCAAIGAGNVPVSLVEPHQGNLDRRATADKEGFNVPGCRLVKTKSVSSKRSF